MIFSAALLVVLSAAAAPQSTAPAGSEAPAKAATAQSTEASQADATAESPVSLKRIQRALSQPAPIPVLEPRMRNGIPVYRVDVEGAKIDIQALLSKEALRGPAPYGAMTHQEFLDLVTPDDVRGYAAFSNGEGITVAATSIALKWAVLRALDAFKKAKDNREREAARKEVEQAVEALKKARQAAGLPEK